MGIAKSLLLGPGVSAAALLTGCRGPHARLDHTTDEKDGRLPVFNYNRAACQAYSKTGEMGRCSTPIGEGPGGRALVVEDGVAPNPFMARQ